ncbi:MAG TPA: DUF309 domain-containing protein [Aggregatilineaceae bacterium]|nr:DUF309 domain-containing protein [Aggregatilineaceae bacterium]
MSFTSDRRPIAILVGDPAWQVEAAHLLDEAGLSVWRVTDQAGYIDRLVEAHAALVLVDGDAQDWRWWVAAAKVRQETRRIPVFVIATGAARAAEALSAGADRFLTADSLVSDLPPAIVQAARVPDESRQARLDCQCAEPMPPLGQQGIARFNAGDYYGQHDLFEALWMAEPGPVRDLYRAILQVGVAYHHITQGNLRGALKMLRRSAQWLAVLPDACQGVDVRQLRADAAAVEAALRALLSSTGPEIDPKRLPPLRTLDGAS